jgi:hypothetical protein
LSIKKELEKYEENLEKEKEFFSILNNDFDDLKKDNFFVTFIFENVIV